MRPKNKTDLFSESQDSYNQLMLLSQQLLNPEQPFSFVVTDKMTEKHWQRDENLRDVLIHLHECIC